MVSSGIDTKGAADSLLFIGTATVFLEVNGVKIIVDPAFYHGSNTVHMGWGLRSKRLLPPAISISDMPSADVLLLTHTHNDHWDDDAKAGLNRDLMAVTNESAAKKLVKDGFSNVFGLKEDQEIEYQGLKIIGMPAQHGPRFMNPFTGSVIGFVIESPKGRLWISGDTVQTNKLKSALHKYHPTVGIVNFGGVKYIIPKLTFTPSTAKATIEDTTIETCFPVHVDDWTHFNTTKEEIEREFKQSQIKIIFPPRGKQIGLWK